MKKYNVAILVGSLRKESWNRKLANAIVELKSERLEFEFIELPISFYNEDLDTAKPPADWQNFRSQIRKADAVLLVTPEYNRSVPAVLKNAVDVASRPYGNAPIVKKPCAVVSASIGAVGGALGSVNLRQALAGAGAVVMQQPEVFLANAASQWDEKGKLNDKSMKFLGTFVAALTEFLDTETIRHIHKL
jgi:chromate reductase